MSFLWLSYLYTTELFPDNFATQLFLLFKSLVLSFFLSPFLRQCTEFISALGVNVILQNSMQFILLFAKNIASNIFSLTKQAWYAND